MLSNAYFLAKFRFDTAENEPAKNLQNFANFPNFANPNGAAASLTSRRARRRRGRDDHDLRRDACDLSGTHWLRRPLTGGSIWAYQPTFSAKFRKMTQILCRILEILKKSETFCIRLNGPARRGAFQ